MARQTRLPVVTCELHRLCKLFVKSCTDRVWITGKSSRAPPSRSFKTTARKITSGCFVVCCLLPKIPASHFMALPRIRDFFERAFQTPFE